MFELDLIVCVFLQQGQRLQSILLQLKLEKLLPPRQSCLMKGHMSLLILYSEQKVDTQNYVVRLLEQINRLNSDEKKLPVLRIMVDGMERIFDKSDIFAFNEYMILGEFTIIFISCSLFLFVIYYFFDYEYELLYDSCTFSFRLMDRGLFIVLFAI